MSNNALRVGTGFDIHRLVAGKPLILGGIHIPHNLGLHGTSDGDALIHAIIDALLGASGSGDIGGLFPVDDPAFDNADSAKLLKQVIDLLKKNSWSIINVDSIVICEQPRMSPWYGAIKKNLAKIMMLAEDAVSIKSKTFEKLGDIGSGAALAVQVVALITAEQPG
jgi:2-C-methyl-D-erythritol 2,4-cyclodiphosphate synthase